MKAANPPDRHDEADAQGSATPADSRGQPCPLCGTPAEPFHADRRRPYQRCPTCRLIHIPAPYHLSAPAEKAQYDLHDNRPDDPRYRRFLEPAADAVAQRVVPPAHGLDFGAGPGSALSVMLAERGYRVDLFDPFYAPDEQALAQRYDFITATEVFEHLRAPHTEIARLRACLRPGGWLIVMTQRAYGDRASFARWHYTHDPTHVAFYSAATFAWLADHFGLRLTLCEPSLAAFQVPAER